MTARLATGFVLLLTIMFLFAPVMALGAGLPTRIVPASCDVEGGCQSICDIALLAQNVLNTGIFIAIFLSAVLFAWAGWQAMTAGGNMEKVHSARSVFTNVLIGLLIILGGWIVIDTLMRTLTNASTFGPWNKICDILWQATSALV
jgi:hypothetical protein